MTQREPSGFTVATADGATISITRNLKHSAIDVWAFLTESPKLGTWYGTWTGDPGSGEVELTFSEAPEQPGRVRIVECTAPTQLEVVLGDAPGGDWPLSITLEPAGDHTRLRFEHTLREVAGAGDIGAGWEYYLDRLEAGLADHDPTQVKWENYHPALVRYYRLSDV